MLILKVLHAKNKFPMVNGGMMEMEVGINGETIGKEKKSGKIKRGLE